MVAGPVLDHLRRSQPDLFPAGPLRGVQPAAIGGTSYLWHSSPGAGWLDPVTPLLKIVRPGRDLVLCCAPGPGNRTTRQAEAGASHRCGSWSHELGSLRRRPPPPRSRQNLRPCSYATQRTVLRSLPLAPLPACNQTSGGIRKPRLAYKGPASLREHRFSCSTLGR
jgi:hypothetical protein